MVKTSAEVAGRNCAAGGVKLELGVDTNRNGTLDTSEVNAALTSYACNGATGLTGPQGLKGDTGPAGARGAVGPGGPKGDTGLTGPKGADGTSVSVTTEPPGPNCEWGGLRLVSASGSNYMCNPGHPTAVVLAADHLNATSYPHSAWFPVDFNYVGPGADLQGADLAGNRFVAPASGLYDLQLFATFCGYSNQVFGFEILINRATHVWDFDSAAAMGHCISKSVRYTTRLAKGDAVSAQLYHGVAFDVRDQVNGIALNVIRLH